MRVWPVVGALVVACTCGASCGPVIRGSYGFDGGYAEPAGSITCGGVTCAADVGCSIVDGAWKCNPCQAGSWPLPDAASPFPTDGGADAAGASCGPFPTFHCLSDSDCANVGGQCCYGGDSTICTTFACATHVCGVSADCESQACVQPVVDGQTLPFGVCE